MMMSFLFPTVLEKSFVDIKVSKLKEMKIHAVFLDMDNTLSIPHTFELYPNILNKINELQQSGIKCIIISNNYRKNVEPLAKKLDLPFVSFSMKPFGRGFIVAKRRVNEKYKNIVVVGDQIFTDIIGANLFGMKSILLEPMTLDEPFTVRLKRKFESRIRKKIKNKKLEKCS